MQELLVWLSTELSPIQAATDETPLLLLTKSENHTYLKLVTEPITAPLTC